VSAPGAGAERSDVGPRVLIVTPEFEPFASGVETHVAEVAPRLLAEGVRLTILTTDPVRRLQVRERIAGVDVRRVRAFPPDSDLHFAPMLARQIATSGPWDLAHIQSYHTLVAPVAMLALILLRIPFVITLHSGGHSSRIRVAARGLQLSLLSPLLRRAERIIAVSEWEEEQFSRALRLRRSRFALIPNGAQLPGAGDAPAAGPPLIVSIGRVERYKGHHHVVAAMPRILETLPDARLRIVGAGPYEGAIRRLARTLGVEAHVQIGPVPGERRDSFSRLLMSASVVTMLSDYESQGIAAYEAADAGRPLVVAYGTALAELVDRGVAVGVSDVTDADAVASAIIAQVRSPLVPRAVELPTWDGCADRVLQLYREILDR
jgi:glycosyltransferase involved in cell wall biosynthesis